MSCIDSLMKPVWFTMGREWEGVLGTGLGGFGHGGPGDLKA